VIRRESGLAPGADNRTTPLRRPSRPVAAGIAQPPLAPPPRPVAPAPQAGTSTSSDPPHRPLAPRARYQRGICRGLRVFVSVSLIASLLVISGLLGGGIWFDTKLHREQVLTDYPDRPIPGRGTNWLLVGSDSRQGLSAEQQQELSTGGDIGSSRTDTIVLVHVPEFLSGIPPTLVSIPRDSFVPIPDHGKDKINAAFAIGGAPLLIQTVEQATGLRLDHYAEIGFGGFAALVDALGGVTVCPAAALHDPLAGIDLSAGCQKLDGRNALGYVRTRDTPRADLDRMVNQRQFLSALLNRCASPAVWLNPWRWYAVPRAAADALTVDRGDHVWDLARLGWALHGSKTAMTVPIREFTTSDVGSVVVWDHDEAAKLFAALESDGPVPHGASDGQP
jgi:LCP family protein required for cell wall assembly